MAIKESQNWRKQIPRYCLSTIFMVAMIGISAEAKEVVFSIRGTVHELDGEFSFFTGQPFEITYSFDPATVDANPNDPKSGKFIGAIKSATLAISSSRGVFTWVAEPNDSSNSIEIDKLAAADSYAAGMSLSGAGQAGRIPASFIVQLTAANANVFNDDKLPSSLDISLFDNQRVVIFTFIGEKQNTYSTIGVITSCSAMGTKH